ncbi:MAG: TetR/AcrR family transcriptional regulator [Solirubrobacteraceae bacterium]|nr:TetR/AcrR family transcriptional regulator [Solirubrobacteraceae bacterium]
MTPGNRRGEATRRQILDAAQRHLLANGYAGTRVEHIAADAEVGVGTVYLHFDNKSGLYSAVMLRAEAVLLDDYLAAAFDLPLPPWERIRAWCRAYVAFTVEHPELARLMGAIEWSEATWNPEVRRHVRERIAASYARLLALFEEAAERDELHGTPPETASRLVWWSMFGIAAQNLRHTELSLEPDALRSLVDSGVHMLSGGRLPPEAP